MFMANEWCTVKIPGSKVSGKNVGEMLIKFDALLEEKYNDNVVSAMRRHGGSAVRRSGRRNARTKKKTRQPHDDIDDKLNRIIRRRR